MLPFAKLSIRSRPLRLVKELRNDLVEMDGKPMTFSEVTHTVAGANQLLQHARACQNSLALVNDLPDEILAHIFGFTVCEIAISRQAINIERLTHVCRRWRAVGLSDARLWTNFELQTHQSFKFFQMFLPRSKGALLAVDYLRIASSRPYERDQESRVLEQLSANTHRLRQLCLQTTLLSDNHLFPLRYFKSPAPNLETLHIYGQGDTDVLPLIFGGHFPRLRDLLLQYFTSWPSGIFKDLTTIELDTQTGSNPIRVTTLLDLLDASPHLLSLFVEEHGPSEEDPTSLNRISTLSCLATLTLIRCHSGIILSHLEIPASTKIIVENFHPIPDIGGSLTQGLPYDCSKIACIQGVTFAQLTGGNGTVGLHFAAGKIDTEVYEDIDDLISMIIMRTSLQGIGDHRAFANLENLEIKWDLTLDNERTLLDFPVELYADVFSHLSQLMHILVEDVVMENLYASLISSTTSVATGIVCPRLRSLTVTMTTFMFPDDCQWLSGLWSFLENRKTKGFPVREVTVRVRGGWAYDGVSDSELQDLLRSVEEYGVESFQASVVDMHWRSE